MGRLAGITKLTAILGLFALLCIFVYQAKVTTSVHPYLPLEVQRDATSGPPDFPQLKSNVTLASREVSRILLVTQYRGGSTFLGEMFARNPKVFYWFEPLIGFKQMYNVKGRRFPGNVIEHMTYLLDKNRAIDLPESFHEEKTKALIDVLNCNIKQMHQAVSDSHVVKHARGAPKEIPYAKCRMNKSPKANTSLALCQPILYRACANADVVAAKTIRYPMSQVDRILRAVPEAKVIYYSRDPRGCMNSRRAIRHYSPTGMVSYGMQLCRRMETDYHSYVKYRDQFPGRVIWIRYEDLATDAVGEVRRLYEFIQKPLSAQLLAWIRVNTNSEKSKGGTYGTRRNSTDTSQKWRKSLSTDVILKMSDVCTNALKLLGYPQPRDLGLVATSAPSSKFKNGTSNSTSLTSTFRNGTSLTAS